MMIEIGMHEVDEALFSTLLFLFLFLFLIRGPVHSYLKHFGRTGSV